MTDSIQHFLDLILSVEGYFIGTGIWFVAMAIIVKIFNGKFLVEQIPACIFAAAVNPILTLLTILMVVACVIIIPFAYIITRDGVLEWLEKFAKKKIF